MCLEIKAVITFSGAVSIVIGGEHEEDFWGSSYRNIFMFMKT